MSDDIFECVYQFLEGIVYPVANVRKGLADVFDELRNFIDQVVVGAGYRRVDLRDGAARCFVDLLGDLSDFRRCVRRCLRGPSLAGSGLVIGVLRVCALVEGACESFSASS